MRNEPHARGREPIEPRCGARCKRTGKPCQALAMPNGGAKFTAARVQGRERRRPRPETRALFAGSEGGTVARARGNTLVGHATRAWDRALRLGEQACYRLRSAIGASWNAASCSLTP